MKIKETKMKSKIITLLLVILYSVPAFAVDIMLGAKSGYYTWRPFYKDFDATFFSGVKNGSGVLYGPVASIIFHPDISLSGVALFGKQISNWHIGNEEGDFGDYIGGNYTMKAERTDIDSALSYRIIPYLKAFIGFKYQKVNTDIVQHERSSSNDNDGSLKVSDSVIYVDSISYGPALGIGFTKSLNNITFLTVNFSALFMWGDFNSGIDGTQYDGTEPIEYNTQEFDPAETIHYGFNFDPSIVSKIADHVIITLGGRFQLLKTKFEEEDPARPGKDVMNDYLYGVFISALFVF